MIFGIFKKSLFKKFSTKIGKQEKKCYMTFVFKNFAIKYTVTLYTILKVKYGTVMFVLNRIYS